MSSEMSAADLAALIAATAAPVDALAAGAVAGDDAAPVVAPAPPGTRLGKKNKEKEEGDPKGKELAATEAKSGLLILTDNDHAQILQEIEDHPIYDPLVDFRKHRDEQYLAAVNIHPPVRLVGQLLPSPANSTTRAEAALKRAEYQLARERFLENNTRPLEGPCVHPEIMADPSSDLYFAYVRENALPPDPKHRVIRADREAQEADPVCLRLMRTGKFKAKKLARNHVDKPVEEEPAARHQPVERPAKRQADEAEPMEQQERPAKRQRLPVGQQEQPTAALAAPHQDLRMTIDPRLLALQPQQASAPQPASQEQESWELLPDQQQEETWFALPPLAQTAEELHMETLRLLAAEQQRAQQRLEDQQAIAAGFELFVENLDFDLDQEEWPEQRGLSAPIEANTY